ncbi:ThiJ/PfpI family protein [Trichoderma cornu-damae]|uniref:ThiJ/PfpI family protein n=1 Tax=Trichoderma cornu-damae TaxID=654480 RepID=A0A9P8TXB5_9HYPO|nr:ThiJ/PfpI family protein [Trichoderma cornu-damae]
MAKIVFLMADYGHDPTGGPNSHIIMPMNDKELNFRSETCGPYTAFKAAGFDVKFATEVGKSARCDMKMLEGLTQRLLGASSSIVKKYHVMADSDEWKNPLSWSDEQFTLDAFDLVFLPGGHDKAVSQVIDSERVHKLLADFFPKTKKPSKKAVGAVCHGVMVLSESKHPDGTSVIRDCATTALPARFEQLAFWGTRLFLGDYYKTYGAGSENVEDSVRKVLASPEQFKSSIVPSPFVVEDENFNYVTARFPGDVELLSQKLVKLVQSL